MTQREKMHHARETQKRIREQLMRENRQWRSPKITAATRDLERRYQNERAQLREKGRYDEVAVEAKIHRVVVTVEWFPVATFPWRRFKKLRGARPLHPTRLWNQVYSSVRRIRCSGAIREIAVQYQRRWHWATPFRVTVIPRRDRLQFEDLRAILDLLPNYKLVTVEYAVDFPIRSIVDLKYVQRYGLFGKMHPRSIGIDPLRDVWGSRKSGIFLRVYARFATEALRVEFELHARFLRRHRLNEIGDLHRLAQILPNRLIFFGRLDENRMEERLRRNGFCEKRRRRVREQVQEKSDVLWSVMRYLRRRAHVTNARRLLVPLPINRSVCEAIKKWAAEWNPKSDIGAK